MHLIICTEKKMIQFKELELDENKFRDSNSIDSYMIDRDSSDGDVSIEMKKKESDNSMNDSLIEKNKNINKSEPK